jgi:pilus assembly protein CpaC
MQQPPPQPAPGAIIITVNGAETRQMSTKKRIATVQNRNEAVASVVPRGLDTIMVVGQAPGLTQITLTDVDGKKDTFDVVVVQFDILLLKSVLAKAVPSANIQPVPAGGNTVILVGTVDRAEDIPLALQAAQGVVGGVQIINAMRVGGVQQVQLDVVVAQVNRTLSRSMAFSFFNSQPGAFFGNILNPQAVTYSGTILPSGLPGVNVNPAAVTTSNLAFGFISHPASFFAFLQALKNENVGKLLAEPKLVTLSGRQASFLSGGEQAVPVASGLGTAGVQFEEFGTRLNFLPIVLGNGKIRLEVEPEISTLDAANGFAATTTTPGVPGRATQRVRTTVEMETGQTLVIGGLIQRTYTNSSLKVPVLGELPFIGSAFRIMGPDNEQELELIVMVTPHFVDPMSCDQVTKCLPGQETRKPDDFELFLEGILEAPRGERYVFPAKHYVPAYKNSPSADQFPCYGNGCGNGLGHGCGNGGCGNGGGMNGHLPAPTPVAPQMPPAVKAPASKPGTLTPVSSPVPDLAGETAPEK